MCEDLYLPRWVILFVSTVLSLAVWSPRHQALCSLSHIGITYVTYLMGQHVSLRAPHSWSA